MLNEILQKICEVTNTLVLCFERAHTRTQVSTYTHFGICSTREKSSRTNSTNPFEKHFRLLPDLWKNMSNNQSKLKSAACGGVERLEEREQRKMWRSPEDSQEDKRFAKSPVVKCLTSQTKCAHNNLRQKFFRYLCFSQSFFFLCFLCI